MEALQYKKIYLYINVPIIILIFVLLFSPIIITDRLAVYYMGVAVRMLLGIWCIFNGVWNACTDYYSILKLKIFQNNKVTPSWAWWLIFMVGVICVITAFMGIGFNNIKKPV
ncbi:hypothetical protein HMPREF1982_01412 [Clostridiales bacterium oral taxon 876 str. F0540]|nr:hypothetical protein HMPREF1982_01412 [Clostridiales bacterium oral taxon 876 str. F0540]